MIFEGLAWLIVASVVLFVLRCCESREYREWKRKRG